MTTSEEGVAKSIKALNHKDTKRQRKTFLPAKRSSDKPRKNFESSCLCRERKLPRRHREEKKAFPLCLRDSVAKAFMTEGDEPSS